MYPLVFCACAMGSALFLYLPQYDFFSFDYVLPIVLLLPLVGALCICLLPSSATHLHRSFALFFTLLTLLFALRLWASFVPTSFVPFQNVFGITAEWKGTVLFRSHFGVDALSLWMVLLTAFLMPLTVLCSWQTMQKNSASFMALLLVLETFLFGAFTCLDLLGFYILYESSLLPMFLLIGLGGSRPRKVRAAYLLVIYTLIGSLVLLPVILLLYSMVGSTSFLVLLHTTFIPSRQYVLWWGLFLAFAVKVPMMPFHLWLPEAHVEASTAGSVLLAGVLLKLGTYGLLRFTLPLVPEANIYYGPFVIVLCLLGIVYASFTTLRQVDLKKVVAYSSIAHMNLVVLSLFTNNVLSEIAASFQMLAHGVASPALFLLVGALYDRNGTKALKYLGGAATAMPLFSIFFFIFSLCNMALPLTPNFVGEFLCLCGIYAHNLVALSFSLIGVLLSAAYTIWAYARVVHGMPKPFYFKYMADLNRREFWALVPLLLLAVWWGLKPEIVLDTLAASLFFWQQTTHSPVFDNGWISAVLSSCSLCNLLLYIKK
jgi:proton-translocating NADH-quinone oxidoreductase chain M